METKEEMQAQISTLAIIKANIKSTGVINLSQYQDMPETFQSDLFKINREIEDYAAKLIQQHVESKRAKLNTIKP